MIHRLIYLGDFNDPFDRQMSSMAHHFDDPHELIEVVFLRCSQWILMKEENDRVAEITKTLNTIPKEIFFMVIVPGVPVHLAAPEELSPVPRGRRDLMLP